MKLQFFPTHYALRSRFDDFEAFREAMAVWDLDFRQLDQGVFGAQLVHVVTPTVILSRSTFSRKIDQNGTPPAGFRTFGIPAHDGVRLRWRGRECDGDTLMLFPADGELDSVSEAGFDVYTVSVSVAALAEAASRRGLPEIDQLFPEARVITYPRQFRTRLRGLAGELVRGGVEQSRLLNSELVTEQIEFELVECLLDAVTHGRLLSSRPMAGSRSRVLKKALEIIHDRADEPVRVSEIQRLTSASMRTLRYAFEEEFGVSPKNYLQSYRLNQVHHELHRADPDAGTISDVANAWGFWHMGQFAKDYRRMFGELPSKTLER